MELDSIPMVLYFKSEKNKVINIKINELFYLLKNPIFILL